MKKLIFFLLFTVSFYGQTYQNPTYGTVTEKSNSTDNTPAYFTTTQVDGVHKKTPAANIEKTANKSDSYTSSSSTTYASTKAVVDGLATKISGTGTTNTIPKFTASGVLGNSIIYDNGSSIGIGTITPSGKLHVSGFSNTTDVGQLILSEIDNPTRKLTIGVNNAANWGFLQMLVSGDNYYPLYINPNGGNVGINTTTDNGVDKLQVNGSISATNYTGSATLTGTPTAPTATAGTNTTQIATTAFVQAAKQGLQSVLDNGASWTKTEDSVIKTIDFSADGLYGSNSDIIFRADKDTKASMFVMTGGSILLKDTDSFTGVTEQLRPSGFYKYVSGGSSTETSIDDPVANTTLKFPAKTVAGTYTLATTDQLRPYKVYTALLSQSGTSAPTATVLENTLGGTVVWTRNTTGQYFGTLSTAFVLDKTFCLTGGNTNNENIHSTTQRNNDNEIVVQSYSSGAKTDGVLNKTAIEIRVYN